MTKGDDMKSIINISKNLTHGEELIVMRKSEFEAMRRNFRELTDAFNKIKRGDQELKNGKTKIVHSLAEIH